MATTQQQVLGDIGHAEAAIYRPYPKLAVTTPCIECAWATNNGRTERRNECRTCGGSRRVPLTTARPL